jgi:hypothetical protein
VVWDAQSYDPRGGNPSSCNILLREREKARKLLTYLSSENKLLRIFVVCIAYTLSSTKLEIRAK